jgi:hypothetical protein
MRLRDAVIDTDAHPCGVVIASAITGARTSTIERILVCDHRPTHALNALDLATVLHRFGYGLWLLAAYECRFRRSRPSITG